MLIRTHLDLKSALMRTDVRKDVKGYRSKPAILGINRLF